jgi:hypothetical protein
MLDIACDRGGGNGNRVKMWKYRLQPFVNRARLEVQVSHFPPGRPKWNEEEHRLFRRMSKNWQGEPPAGLQTVVDLIGTTQTTRGFKVICVRNDTQYEPAEKAPDEEFASTNLKKIAPFESWNHRILPR